MTGVATMGPVIAGGWVVDKPDNRGFTRAVIVSIVFHGLLLATWQSVHQPVLKPSIAPGPIVARLAAPRQQVAAPVPTPVTEEAAKPRVEEPTPPTPTPVAKPQPSPVAKPAPVAKPSPTPAPTKAAPSAETPKPSAEPAPAAPAAPAAPGPVAKADPQPAGSPAAKPSPSVEEDEGSLEKYRLSLIGTAKKYWKQPPRPVDATSDEVRVVVRLVLGANGMISSLDVKGSSGFPALDKAAVETIRKAKPLIPIPPTMRGREVVVEVPFVIRLDVAGG
jgi:protein TonB